MILDFLKDWKKDDLNETLDLDETVEVSYREDNDLPYHMFTNLNDLLVSLDNEHILANANNGRDAQVDSNVEACGGYVCFTQGFKGKNGIVNNYNEPYGLSFKEHFFKNILEKKNGEEIIAVENNENKWEDVKELYRAEYNQYGKLTTLKYKEIDSFATSKVTSTSDPFYYYSIGELADNVFFVCGGQKPQGRALWNSRIFNDRELYNYLVNKFIDFANKGRKEALYHFKNGYIGDLIKTSTEDDDIYNFSGNLNKDYEWHADRPSRLAFKDEKASAKGGRVIGLRGRYASNFKEILGFGPIKVNGEIESLDKRRGNRNLLTLNNAHILSYASGRYSGVILGNQIDNKIDDEITDEMQFTYIKDVKDSKNNNKISHNEGDLAAVKLETKYAKILNDLYNEIEYRVYTPKLDWLHFNSSDINSLIFPKYIAIKTSSYLSSTQDKKYALNLKGLLDCINDHPSITKQEIMTEYRNDTKYNILLAMSQRKIQTRHSKDWDKIIFPPYIERIIDIFIKFFGSAGKYKDVKIEFISTSNSFVNDSNTNNEISSEISLNVDEVNLDNNYEEEKNSLDDIIISKTGNKRTLMSSGFDSIFPDYEKIRTDPNYLTTVKLKDENTYAVNYGKIKGKAKTTTTKLNDRGLEKIRLGSEVLVFARDLNNNLYMLMVKKPNGNNFFELPGGGFNDATAKPSSEKSFLNLAQSKLEFKCGLKLSDLSKMQPLHRGLILDERKIDSKLPISLSYYKLFYCYLKEPIIVGKGGKEWFTYDNSKHDFSTSEVDKDFYSSNVKKSQLLKRYTANMVWIKLDEIRFSTYFISRYDCLENIFPSLINNIPSVENLNESISIKNYIKKQLKEKFKYKIK